MSHSLLVVALVAEEAFEVFCEALAAREVFLAELVEAVVFVVLVAFLVVEEGGIGSGFELAVPVTGIARVCGISASSAPSVTASSQPSSCATPTTSSQNAPQRRLGSGPTSRTRSRPTLDTAVGDARNRMLGQVVVCTTPLLMVTVGRAAWKSSHSCASRVASSTALAECARNRSASEPAFPAS